MARSTCDGSTPPAAQAAPVETATPSRSRAIRRPSASTPVERDVGGVRAAGARRRCARAPGRASRRSSSRSRRAPRRAASASRRLAREGGGRAEAHDAGHVLRAGPAVALLAAAAHERGQRRPAPHVEAAHALRAVELVGGEGEQVDVEGRARRPAPCPRPARRRSGRGRPARGRAGPPRPPAAGRRSRCWPASPRRRRWSRRPSPRGRPRSTTPAVADAGDRDRPALVAQGLRRVQDRVVLDRAARRRRRAASFARRQRRRAGPCCPTRCRSR